MTADKNGVAIVDIVDPLISLSGEYSIIGRTMVVHENQMTWAEVEMKKVQRLETLEVVWPVV